MGCVRLNKWWLCALKAAIVSMLRPSLLSIALQEPNTIETSKSTDRFELQPQVRWDYPLSLSISISGGKETYKDSPSNGERTGNSPA